MTAYEEPEMGVCVFGGVEAKDTNPKDVVGATKSPLDVVPHTALHYAAMAFYEGRTKYGGYNWRVAGVRTSIYVAALLRHTTKFWNGEWADPKTHVPHLASVLACAAIILDAKHVGKLTDDRPPPADMAALEAEVAEVVRHLNELHAHIHPTHHHAKD